MTSLESGFAREEQLEQHCAHAQTYFPVGAVDMRVVLCRSLPLACDVIHFQTFSNRCSLSLFSYKSACIFSAKTRKGMCAQPSHIPTLTRKHVKQKRQSLHQHQAPRNSLSRVSLHITEMEPEDSFLSVYIIVVQRQKYSDQQTFSLRWDWYPITLGLTI